MGAFIFPPLLFSKARVRELGTWGGGGGGGGKGEVADGCPRVKFKSVFIDKT